MQAHEVCCQTVPSMRTDTDTYTNLTCTYLIQTQTDIQTDRQTHLHFGSKQILHCCLSVVEDASEGVSFSLDLLNLMAQHIQTLFDAK